MSDGSSGSWLFLVFLGAGLLLLVQLMLSIALVAASALSRIALHRLGTESGGRLAFLEEFRQAWSAYRSAATLLRQLCLLGAAALLAVGLSAMEVSNPIVLAVVLAGVVGVLALEGFAARSLALWDSRRALKATAFSIRAARLLLYPVVVPLDALLQRIGRSQRLSDEEREEEQEEEVEALIEVGEREGLLEAEEGEMMRGIVDLDEKLVREIMTPRTDIEAIPAETLVAAARAKLLEVGRSKLPVFHGSIDNVVGVLHSRDLFRAWEESRESQPVSHYVRPATFVPETLSAAELLAEMRQKTQIALVVDEYGGTAGLVTLEDLLEEIVGEIRDEHEDEEELVCEEEDGSYVINAVAHVDELESLFGVDFDERDFDTVGGLVVSTLGRVPLEGESVDTCGLRLVVMEADPRRVHLVRVRKLAAEDGTVEST